jgi:hypothetical protein
VTWPDQVPLGQAFAVREPLWNWGFGAQMIDGDGTAIGTIVAGVLFNLFAVFILVHLFKLARRWLRHRQLGRQMAGATRLPGRADPMATPAGATRLPGRADPMATGAGRPRCGGGPRPAPLRPARRSTSSRSTRWRPPPPRRRGRPARVA